jgi:flagellar motor switch protein FliN/FliY
MEPIDQRAPASSASRESMGADTFDLPSLAQPGNPGVGSTQSIEFLRDVPLRVTVELGRTRLLIKDVLALRNGSVVELDRQAGAPVDVLVNGILIARGEVVVVDERFGVRINEVVPSAQISAL